MAKIMENKTTNGAGTAVPLTQHVRAEFIYHTLYVMGTLNGGNIVCSVQPIEGEAFVPVLGNDLTPLTITEIGAVDVLVRGNAFNATLADAGGSADVTVYLI